MSHSIRPAVVVLALGSFAAALFAETKPRARDLGVPFDGTPGPNNAITDVKGVEVGHTTLISGEGQLVVGKGPVRTGVTAIHPRGKNSNGVNNHTVIALPHDRLREILKKHNRLIQ